MVGSVILVIEPKIVEIGSVIAVVSQDLTNNYNSCVFKTNYFNHISLLMYPPGEITLFSKSHFVFLHTFL